MSQELEPLLQGVFAGQVKDISNLYRLITPRVAGFFAARVPTTGTELATLVMSDIENGLYGLDPDFPKTGQPADFFYWVSFVSQRRLQSYLACLISERRLPQAGEPLEEDYGDQLLSQLKPWLVNILSSPELTATSLRISGRPISEIATLMGTNYKSVTRTIAKARQTIEEEIVNPAGYQKLSGWHDNSLVTAAHRGQLAAFKLLGMWYSNLESVNSFQQHQRLLEESVLTRGYILLVDHVAPDEYATLIRNSYKAIILRYNKRLYIRPKDLENFRRDQGSTDPVNRKRLKTGRVKKITQPDNPLQKQLEATELAEFRDWFFSCRYYTNISQASGKKREIFRGIATSNGTTVFDEFSGWLNKAGIILMPFQLAIIKEKLANRTNQEISATLNCSLGILTSHFSEARATIERKLFSVANIKNCTEYPSLPYLDDAARKGRLEAIFFLGHWYTTDEAVTKYLNIRKPKS